MAIDFELAGKKALVTGGGQGVGRGIANMLAQAGATVVVNDFVADRAKDVAAEIVAAGGKAEIAPFDVTNFEMVHDVFNGIGGVDILVNNAGNQGAEGGFGDLTRFHETTPADWDKYFAVNMYGVMNCVHAALPNMIDKQWGRVITISSDSSRVGEPNMAAYGAAKAAAGGFSRCLAKEVGRHNITVNCIALGTMRTPMTEGLWGNPDLKAHQDTMLKPYVVRRPGSPEDPAWIVAMLSSPKASWITGQTHLCNGGYSFNQ